MLPAKLSINLFCSDFALLVLFFTLCFEEYFALVTSWHKLFFRILQFGGTLTGYVFDDVTRIFCEKIIAIFD